jgi:hypothetical protein
MKYDLQFMPQSIYSLEELFSDIRFNHYFGLRVQELRKSTKILGLDSQFRAGFESVHYEYKIEDMYSILFRCVSPHLVLLLRNCH